MVKKHLSVKKGLTKVSNKSHSHSSKRLLSKSRNAVSVSVSSPSQNETKRHEYCVGCKCKVDIINIKKNNIKGKGGILRPCITGECVKGHKWVRFVKNNNNNNNNNTSSKSMKGGASGTSGTTIEFIKRIHYATIKDFIDAQKNGIQAYTTKIPGTNTKFDRGDGSTFDTALKEIQSGNKEKHWIWYIIPSSTPPLKGNDDKISRTTFFFSLGNGYPDDKTISPHNYISDTSLFENYVTIINAIHDVLAKKDKTSLLALLGSIDYDKLCNSLEIFRDIVVAKLLYDKKPIGYSESIKKINTLSDICTDEVYNPPPQQQLLPLSPLLPRQQRPQPRQQQLLSPLLPPPSRHQPQPPQQKQC